MSLRHALLGLLAEKPATGFELTRQFEQVLSSFAWHTTHSHIYPELKRMDDDGLAEVIATASRGRKTYAITDTGREELRRWLMAPPVDQVVRNEAALRMMLISALKPDEARAVLRRYAEDATQQLEMLEARISGAPEQWQNNPLAVGRLAAERGLRILPAVRAWAEWGIEQLGDTERRSEQPAEKTERPA